MKNVGRLKMSKDLLEQIIPLPKGTKILGVRTGEHSDKYIEFYVESEGIRIRKEGEICPEVSAAFDGSKITFTQDGE
jgi:hypothetical protein